MTRARRSRLDWRAIRRRILRDTRPLEMIERLYFGELAI